MIHSLSIQCINKMPILNLKVYLWINSFIFEICACPGGRTICINLLMKHISRCFMICVCTWSGISIGSDTKQFFCLSINWRKVILLIWVCSCKLRFFAVFMQHSINTKMMPVQVTRENCYGFPCLENDISKNKFVFAISTLFVLQPTSITSTSCTALHPVRVIFSRAHMQKSGSEFFFADYNHVPIWKEKPRLVLASIWLAMQKGKYGGWKVIFSFADPFTEATQPSYRYLLRTIDNIIVQTPLSSP